MAGSRGLDLADDRRNQFLLQPFTVFIDLDDIEPPRDCRRLFGLSYAAMDTQSSMA